MQESLPQDLEIVVVIGLAQALVLLVLDLTDFVGYVEGVVEPAWLLFLETKIIFGVEEVAERITHVELKVPRARSELDEEIYSSRLGKQVSTWELHAVDIEFIDSVFVREIRDDALDCFIWWQIGDFTGCHLERHVDFCLVDFSGFAGIERALHFDQ